MTKNEWNERCRESIDALLAERGFSPDCSIRNQLSVMNFAPVSLDDAIEAAKQSGDGVLADLNHIDVHCAVKAALEFAGVSYE